MTTLKLIQLYRLLIDKYGSPYHTDDEIIDFINIATVEYLNRLVPDNQGGVVNYEHDYNVSENIRPLIYSFNVNTNPNGLLQLSVINSALQANSGQPDAELFRLLSMGIGNVPVKYEKHNNLLANFTNVFKRPTHERPVYTIVNDGYQLYPDDTSYAVHVSVLKKPVTISLTTDPELSDYSMYNILGIALKLGGVSVRDGELIQAINASSNQISI